VDLQTIKQAMKEAKQELKKVSKRKIKVTSTMNCCPSCHTAEAKQKFDGYLAPKIYKSGMNKNIQTINDWHDVVLGWDLNDVELVTVVTVLEKYFEVIKPLTEYECIIGKIGRKSEQDMTT
jgi:nitrate/TMAO reductase-like tetraheme cytochrome c subunit